MIIILLALLSGWLLHFIHLNDVFRHLLGFSDTQYYLVWFFLGCVTWFTGRIKNR
jgi:hypothetical protein